MVDEEDDFVTLFIPVDLIPKDEDEWAPASKSEKPKADVRKVQDA